MEPINAWTKERHGDDEAEPKENWRLCQTKERPITIAPLP